MKRLFASASMLLLVTAGSLQAQTLEERVSALEARMDAIESRVARLETFHPNREFTITQGNFTLDEFNSYITNLDVKDGEWVYIKATGKLDQDNNTDKLELCTTDTQLTSIFGYYLNGNPDDNLGREYYFHGSPQSGSTYNKSKITESNYETNWEESSLVIANSLQNERLKLRANGPGGAFQLDVSPSSSYIYVYSSDQEIEVTFKAGTSRMEACGF